MKGQEPEKLIRQIIREELGDATANDEMDGMGLATAVTGLAADTICKKAQRKEIPDLNAVKIEIRKVPGEDIKILRVRNIGVARAADIAHSGLLGKSHKIGGSFLFLLHAFNDHENKPADDYHRYHQN